MLWVLAVPTWSVAQSPTTSPAAVNQVIVLRFTELVDQESTDWIGHAVQQNLLADLGRAQFHPTTLTIPIDDPAAAARAVGARFAITGTYQFADDLLRVSG